MYWNQNPPSPGEAGPWGSRSRSFPCQARQSAALAGLQKITLLCPGQETNYRESKDSFVLCMNIFVANEWVLFLFHSTTCPFSPSFFSLLMSQGILSLYVWKSLLFYTFMGEQVRQCTTCPFSPSFFSLLPLWKPAMLESTKKREIPCAAWFVYYIFYTMLQI